MRYQEQNEYKTGGRYRHIKTNKKRPKQTDRELGIREGTREEKNITLNRGKQHNTRQTGGHI